MKNYGLIARPGLFRHTLRTVWIALAGLGLFVAAPAAQAHPGHGWQEAGWTHLLLSPDHWLGWAFLGVVLACAGRWAQRSRLRRVFQWGGAGMAMVALAMWWVLV